MVTRQQPTWPSRLACGIFPSGIAKLPVPLALSLLAAILARALRDFWLLLGPGEERAPAVLEEICARRGIDRAARDGGMVLKRLGTALRRIGLFPGAGLVRLDRRRREPEVDRIGREWGRILWRSGGKA